MSPRPSPEVMAAYYGDSENYRFWAEHIFPASEAARRDKIHLGRSDSEDKNSVTGVVHAIEYQGNWVKVTIVKPNEVQGKKSKVDITIDTGRTHQIRVHLAHVGHSIVGDEQYGSRTQAKRLLLHARSITLLGQTYTAPEPADIVRYK